MLLFGHSRVSEHALVDAINMPRFNALYSSSIYLNLLRAFKLMDTLFSLPANSQNKLVGRSPMMIFTLDFACSDRHYPHVGFHARLVEGEVRTAYWFTRISNRKTLKLCSIRLC